MGQDVEIRANPDRWRFEAYLGDEVVGALRWRHKGQRLAFISTNVEPAYEGRGIGGQLVKTGLDWARSEGKEVIPVCPFVRAYVERHPDYLDIIAA